MINYKLTMYQEKGIINPKKNFPFVHSRSHKICHKVKSHSWKTEVVGSNPGGHWRFSPCFIWCIYSSSTATALSFQMVAFGSFALQFRLSKLYRGHTTDFRALWVKEPRITKWNVVSNARQLCFIWVKIGSIPTVSHPVASTSRQRRRRLVEYAEFNPSRAKQAPISNRIITS